jgi:hypothetical protein
MKKFDNWHEHFDAFILRNADKPFSWGEWDCCVFSNACLNAITGDDLIPDELYWDDEKSATETIYGYGRTLLNSIRKAAKKKNLLRIDNMHLQKGDLVIIQQGENQVCGIYDGSRTIGPSKDGIIALDHNKVIEGWRVNA